MKASCVRNTFGICVLAVWLTCSAGAFAQEPGKGGKSGKGSVQPNIRKLSAGVAGVIKAVMVTEGQAVKKGEILAQLDNRQALLKMRVAELQVKRAQAELKSAEAATGETKAQYERLVVLIRSNPAVVSADELSMKKFVWEKHKNDEKVREADLQIAHVELDMARLLLEKHAIPAQANGVVRAIFRRSGEAVRELDVVIRLQVDDGNK